MNTADWANLQEKHKRLDTYTRLKRLNPNFLVLTLSFSYIATYLIN